jgi:hypothetical protein
MQNGRLALSERFHGTAMSIPYGGHRGITTLGNRPLRQSTQPETAGRGSDAHGAGWNQSCCNGRAIVPARILPSRPWGADVGSPLRRRSLFLGATPPPRRADPRPNPSGTGVVLGAGTPRWQEASGAERAALRLGALTATAGEESNISGRRTARHHGPTA